MVNQMMGLFIVYGDYGTATSMPLLVHTEAGLNCLLHFQKVYGSGYR